MGFNSVFKELITYLLTPWSRALPEELTKRKYHAAVKS
jgi:hypothetical protein